MNLLTQKKNKTVHDLLYNNFNNFYPRGGGSAGEEKVNQSLLPGLF